MELELDYQKSRKSIRRNRILRKLFSWILPLAAVVLLAFIIVNIVLEKTVVPGDSMELTLSAEDTILVNKFAYLFRGPQRNDIVVFKQSGSEHDYYDIKRVIGLPGETIQIIDGQVWVDGELSEDIINCENMLIPGLARDAVTLEENEYFVLGDNRNNSEDSRFANVGTIVRENLIGKAWIRMNEFGFVHKFNLKTKGSPE